MIVPQHLSVLPPIEKGAVPAAKAYQYEGRVYESNGRLINPIL